MSIENIGLSIWAAYEAGIWVVMVDRPGDPGRSGVTLYSIRLCGATMEMFVSILASEAGNLALKVLATGGIYVAGGIAANSLRKLQEPAFMRAFTNKGRFSELMKRIPVHVIITNAALTGAAAYALDNLTDYQG